MATMEITTRIGCKNACVYCPQDKLISAYGKKAGNALMSFDTFKACVDKIPVYVDIEFSGMAEPWLNPECTKMALYAHQKGNKINVYTTLAGMTEKDVDELEKIPFNRFWVHLPSSNGEEKIIVDENYLKVLDRMRRFFDSKKDSLETSFHFRGQCVHPKIEALLGAVIKRKKLSTRANNVALENKKAPEIKRGNIICQRGLHSNVLLPNGDVLLCCMDYGMRHILGNLLTDSYESLFAGAEFKKITAGLKDETIDSLCRWCDMFAEQRNTPFLRRIAERLRNFFGIIKGKTA